MEKSFVTQSIDHDRWIQPVLLKVKIRNSFTILLKIRKQIGIKGNIEMFFSA